LEWEIFVWVTRKAGANNLSAAEDYFVHFLPQRDWLKLQIFAKSTKYGQITPVSLHCMIATRPD
jgi:hypothetical protein